MNELPVETRDKNHRTLADRIRSATLAGEFFEHYGALECVRDLLNLVKGHGGDLTDAYAVATSTHYAAIGNAWARWRLAPLKFWWLWRAVRCFCSASHHAGDMKHAAGELENLNVGQLLIFASVSRLWPSGRDEAERCIAIGLGRKETQYDDRILLLLQMAADLEGRAGGVREVFVRIKHIIDQGGVTPLTRVRYFRAYAKWLRRQRSQILEAHAQQTFDEAEDLATRAKLGDQLVKIRAERR